MFGGIIIHLLKIHLSMWNIYLQIHYYIFLNLETTISQIPLDDSYKDDKVFNYQATGNQLVHLEI